MDKKNYINTLKITLLGRFLYAFFSKRRKIALTNIALVFGSSLTPAEQIKLAKGFFSHFAEQCKESYWHYKEKRSFAPRIELRGLEHVQKAKEKGKGTLFLTAHLGSWDLIILRGLAPHPEFNLHIVRKKQKKTIQSFIAKCYQKAGLKIIYHHGAARAIINALKSNQQVLFAFDQHADVAQNSGIAGEFFSHKAGCTRTLPVLAKKTQACVIPINAFRAGNNHHVIEFHPELTWISAANEDEEIEKNIQQYNQVLEQFILSHPEQWWWVHRRWKLNSELYC